LAFLDAGGLVKTIAVVFFFGIVGLFGGIIAAHLAFESTGPVGGILAVGVGIPLCIGAGVTVGFYVAQRF
jgi:hypothetical protein